jgi:hypothetical protein
MLRKFRNAWRLLLAIALCAALSLTSCGHKEISAPSEGGGNSSASTAANPAGLEPPELPIDQQTEQKLDPLSKDDVDLYLKVMRAAADRVKNPLPADKAALDGAKKVLGASAAGHLPTPADVKTLERANLVAISMDQIVAEEMKLDGRTYRGIAEAVESVVSNPVLRAASGEGGAPVPARVPTQLEKRIGDVNAANEKILVPYRDEIKKLVAAVRDPANLPK